MYSLRTKYSRTSRKRPPQVIRIMSWSAFDAHTDALFKNLRGEKLNYKSVAKEI